MRPGIQRSLNLAKRLQRRLYLADYQDAELRHRWSEPAASAPYREQVFSVAPDPSAIRSLLVFKPDEIGDAVCGLPAAAELRRAFPQARMFLLCQRLTEPLYARTGIFDEIVAVAPQTRLSRPHFPLQEALGQFSQQSFDMSVYLRTYSASFRQFRQIPAGIRVHPVDPMMRSDSVHRASVSLWTEQRRHQSLQLLQIVERVSGRAYGWEDVRFPAFRWTAEDEGATVAAFGARDAGPYIAIHPFAKHETRQYPLELWSELITRLRERIEAEWVIIGGPGDPQLQGLPGVLQTQGELTLAQSGYLMSRAAAFMGVLSGPAHWSAALGTPTVTIMSGHSLPVEWGPLGDSLIVRADVPCAPCHQPTCPVYGLACLRELVPQRIGPDVERFLARALETPSAAASTR